MAAILKQSNSDMHNMWTVTNNDKTIGRIRRMNLDKGMCFTHSSITANETFDSFHYESGSVYNFVFVLNGLFDILTENRFYRKTMSKGSAYAFKTGDEKISKILKKNISSEAIIIKVSEEKMDELLSDTGSALADGMETHCFKKTAELMCRRMLSCKYSGGTACTYLQSAAVDLLVSEFMTHSANTTGTEQNTVYEIVDYIEKNHSADFTLSGLARMAGVSHTKLNRIFRDVTGTSVFDYIRNSRIKTAENYLSKSDMSITEIAMNTGFSSSSHFYSCFLKAKGISPKNFRSRSNGNN
ncbi:AraC family transcriptional regulator [Seleniivibrio sp.]|uniref:helix-turn-helix domain-containing protein n=1 Tax=Seleniivibrio sp. TaxID=2898801 RepID=UPI0025F8B3B4|nr:AraC family transcriptional regulator [Seleniivibrio sp.]MCD8553621.1 AraC family transcriptional regulator [Seleniivibrio sp.]